MPIMPRGTVSPYLCSHMTTALTIGRTKELTENIAELLELSGYRVITTISYEEGLKLAVSGKPDLIIYDETRPDNSSLRFYEGIEKQNATHSIPMLILTDNIEMRKSPGAKVETHSCLLQKPFTGEELSAAVKRLGRLP